MISEKASTALATVGTVCWCIQLIPQIWYNWKRKDCTGLPPLMMFLWVVSGIPFAIYFCVSEGNMTLQVQPHLFMVFCLASFVQSCYYPPVSLPVWKIIAIVGTFAATDIGMEIGFILWLRPLYRKGTRWPALIFGILASIFLAVGLVPPYFELAKRKGRVVGINFIFLFIDSLGAWLSIVSVVVGNMDVMGIILYCVVAALELGIFLSHFIWWCRFRWLGTDNTIEDDETFSEREKITEREGNGKDTNDYCQREDGSIHTEVNEETLDDYESLMSRSTNARGDRTSQMLHAVHGVSLQRNSSREV